MSYHKPNNYYPKYSSNYNKTHYNSKPNKEVSIYDETFPNKFNYPYQKPFKHYNKPKYSKTNSQHFYINNFSKPNYQHIYLSSSSTTSTQSSSPPPSITSPQTVNFPISNNISIHNQTPSNTSQVLLNKYEGICNFIIFAKECSLYINKINTKYLKEITFKSFFDNFDYFIICGCEISFMSFHNQIVNVNYTLTLSSMLLYINIPSNEMFQTILKSIKDKNFKEKTYMHFEIDDSLQIFFDLNNNLLKIEYYENKPPHQRKLITDQIEYMLNVLELNEMLIMKYIDNKSWFCFMWMPIHATQSEFNGTSFLVYYQFASNEKDLCDRGYDGYYEIPIIGILPCNFNEELWLRKIKKVSLGNLYYHREYMDFKMALNDSILNVHEFIFRDTDRTSVDYDFYLRNSKSNLSC